MLWFVLHPGVLVSTYSSHPYMENAMSLLNILVLFWRAPELSTESARTIRIETGNESRVGHLGGISTV
jgi:hypothetical protein